jgi:hypothetical protein
LLSVGVTLASLAVVGVASAHSFQAEITCTHVSYFFGAFDVGSTNNVIHEQVSIDTTVVADLNFSFNGVEGTNTVPINVPAGTHTVTASGTWTVAGGGTQTVTQTLSGCLGAPATPALTTTASGPVTVGGAIHDTAHLSGGSSPTGTISFDVYDSTCATKLATVGATAAVNGAGDYVSANYTPTTAGSYKWVAHYSGDANNNKVDTSCGAEGETSTVNQTAPSIATTLSAGTVTAGASVHDSAALSGATASAGGSVTYTVYTNNTCTAGAQGAGTKTVTNGLVPDSDTVLFNTPGDFYWRAVYGGDTNNAAATSLCTSEHLVVNAPPTTPTSESTPTVTTASTPTPTPTVTPAPTVTNQPSTPAKVTTPAKPKPKPKPKSFKPPAVKEKVKSSPPPCYDVTVGPKNLTVGEAAKLRLRVTGRNKPISGTTVSIKGAGMLIVSGRTNSAGQVTLTVHPKKPGLVLFRSASHKSCSTARVGVASAFTPPVTG